MMVDYDNKDRLLAWDVSIFCSVWMREWGKPLSDELHNYMRSRLEEEGYHGS